MQIPCDPKLLLPPYNKEELAAFKLTEVEKDLQKVGTVQDASVLVGNKPQLVLQVAALRCMGRACSRFASGRLAVLR